MAAIDILDESPSCRTQYIVRVEVLDGSLWIGVDTRRHYKSGLPYDTSETVGFYVDSFPEILEDC